MTEHKKMTFIEEMFRKIWFAPFWTNVKINILDFIPGEYLVELRNLCYWTKLNNNFVLKYMKKEHFCHTYIILSSINNWISTHGIQYEKEYKIPPQLNEMLYKYASKTTYLQIKNKFRELIKETNEFNENEPEELKKIKMDELVEFEKGMTMYD